MKKKLFIGSYEILEKIGEGGFGVVYRAKDTTLDREVAIKIHSVQKTRAKPGEDSSEDICDEKKLEKKKKQKAFEERFIKEAQNAAKLDHPNIAKIYYAGVENNLRYFAMEHISGKSVDDLIDEEGPFSVPLTLHVVYYAVSALAEALKYGIIHRDIKPSNIMITEDYAVKIVDFGLSKILSEDSSITADGSCFGTPNFMSPEQCKGEFLDFRSDIYSLGITMFYMLTHKYPFEANDQLVILNKHVNEQLPDVTLFANDRVTQDVKSLLQKMTNKNPDDRYQSYVVLLSELRKLRLRYPFINDKVEEEAIQAETKAGLYGVDKNTDDLILEHKNMKEEFKNLIKNGDIFEIEEFLIKYPENEYSKLLEEKLSNLRDEAEKFKKAEMLDVYEEWEKFLNLFPDGKYSQFAHERIEVLKEIREKEDNKKAQKLELFERAKNKNTKEDYEQFLLLYPNSEESVHVRSLLEILDKKVTLQQEDRELEKPSSSFIRLIDKTEDLIEKKKYQDALDILNNILHKKPNHVKAQMLKEKIFKIRPKLSPFYREKGIKVNKVLIFSLLLIIIGFLFISDLYIHRSVITAIIPEITKNNLYVNFYYRLRPVFSSLYSGGKIAEADENIEFKAQIVNIRSQIKESIKESRFFTPEDHNFIYYLRILELIDDNKKYYNKLKYAGINKMLEIAGYYDSLLKYEESEIIYDHILLIDPDNPDVKRRLRIREYRP